MTSKLKTFLSLIEFPTYESAELELKKIGLLRWVLGVVVFVRMGQIYDAYSIYHGGAVPPEVDKYMVVLFSAIALFTIGFFTQVATICVAVGVRLSDGFFNTSSLGTDILSGTLFTFFLLNAGQFYSIDSLILRTRALPARGLSPFLRFIGAGDLWDIKGAYFLGFLFYALLSFVALSFHLEDQYWLNGVTTKALLVSSYLSKFYWVFRAIDETHPTILGLMSVVGGIGQTIFQFLMLPLIFTKIGRYFVATWGMGFILVSLLNINLSYLPHIELILWVMIFCPVRSARKKVEVFFDDSCRLCSRTMRALKWLNYNSRVVFSPLSANLATLQAAGISEEQARRSMYGIASGKIIEGYNLYVTIAKGNILLWAFLPFLLLGYLGRIGPRLYQLVASRRFRNAKECSLGPVIPFSISASGEATVSCGFISGYIKGLVYATFIACFFLYLLTSLNPWRETILRLLGPQTFSKISSHLTFLGLEVPNVFNKQDLQMSDQWLELYVREGDSWVLVPITDPNGARINYSGFDWLFLANHNSDYLYFSDTLPFCRYFPRFKDNYPAHFVNDAPGHNVAAFRAKYDYHRMKRSGRVTYRAIMRRCRSSEVTLWESNSSLFTAEVVFQQDYTFDSRNGFVPIPGTMRTL